jgi:hypothetical protein
MPQCKKNCQELNTQTYSIISQKNTHLKTVTAQQLTASFSQILIINPMGVHFIRYVAVYATYITKLFLGQRVETEATITYTSIATSNSSDIQCIATFWDMIL